MWNEVKEEEIRNKCFPLAEHFCSAGDLTWGRLALSNQEGALRVPGGQQEPHGFISRDVPEEPPAARAHSRKGFFFPPPLDALSEPLPLPSGIRRAAQITISRLPVG